MTTTSGINNLNQSCEFLIDSRSFYYNQINNTMAIYPNIEHIDRTIPVNHTRNNYDEIMLVVRTNYNNKTFFEYYHDVGLMNDKNKQDIFNKLTQILKQNIWKYKLQKHKK